MKRQLLWNVRALPQEQSAGYIFAIVNDPREIEAISSRIVQALAPVEEYQDREGGVGDLNYKLMLFQCNRTFSRSRMGNVYRGQIKKDTNLYERKTTGIDGLEAYLVKKLEGKVNK